MGTPSLTDRDYEALRDAATTHREALIVRLAGEVGLTTTEIPTVRPADIRQVTNTPPRFVLEVANRTAFLPASLRRAIERYANSNTLRPSEPLVDLTPRRIQMILDEVTDRAAHQTGKRPLSSVTSQDLRQYFAYTALVDRGVPYRIVRAVGGWESGGPLAEYLPPVEAEEIVAAFTGQSGSLVAAPSGIETLTTATDSILETTSQTDVLNNACQALADGTAYLGAFAFSQNPVHDAVRILTTAGVTEATSRQLATAANRAIEELTSGSSSFVVSTPPSDLANAVGTDHVAFVPISQRDGRLGILGVLPTEGREVPDSERQRLSVFGRQIAQVMAANRRRALLESDAAIELELSYGDPDAPLVQLSRQLSVPFALESLVVADQSTYLCYVVVETSQPASVVDAAEHTAGIDEVRLVERRSESVLFELTLSGNSPLSVILDAGGDIETITVSDETARVVAYVPDGTNIRDLIGTVRSLFPDTELLGKRSRDRVPAASSSPTMDVTAELTERQQSVLRAAFFGGYFDWPRGSTAEEIADSMDVSSPTFHKHLRQGLHTVLDSMLDANTPTHEAERAELK